ncbi:MAG: hypothetical protein QW303_07885 [Nitrososphaerota archaeon]
MRDKKGEKLDKVDRDVKEIEEWCRRFRLPKCTRDHVIWFHSIVKATIQRVMEESKRERYEFIYGDVVDDSEPVPFSAYPAKKIGVCYKSSWDLIAEGDNKSDSKSL